VRPNRAFDGDAQERRAVNADVRHHKTRVHEGAMQFTEFQRDRIKRFFLAVGVLSNSPEMRMNPGRAILVLKKSMDPVEMPPETLPDVPVLDAQASFFAFLSEYGRRDRVCRKTFGILLTIAFAIGAYEFYQSGILDGVVILGGALIGAFILNVLIMKIYVVRGFSPLQHGLTHTEVSFALDQIIADPQWQRNLHSS